MIKTTESSAGSEKIWLVRSSGRIVGPYTLEELIQELKDGNLLVIDEVRTPETRWGFIRDHKQLVDVVEFLREQSAMAIEETEIVTKSQTGFRTSADDLTPTPEMLLKPNRRHDSPLEPKPSSLPPARPEIPRPEAARPETKKEVGPLEPKKVVANLPAEVPAARTGQQTPPPAPIDVQYTEVRPIPPDSLEVRSPESSSSVSRFVWIIAFVAIAGVVAVLLQKNSKIFVSRPTQPTFQFSEKDFELGKYSESLRALQEATNLDASRLKILALLQIQIAKQAVEGMRTLEKLKAAPGAVSKTEIGLVEALANMREQNWSEAGKVLSKTAGGSMEELVRINQIMIDLQKGNFENAFEEAQRLLQAKTSAPEVPLLFGFSAFRGEGKEKAKLKKATEELKTFIGKSENFKLEALLMKAALHFKLGEKDDSDESVDSLLKLQPNLTALHLKNLWVDQQILSWENLQSVCEYLSGGETSARKKALMALCTYEAGEKGKAIQMVEEAKQQFAADNLFIPLHSFLLKSVGQIDNARNLGKMMSHSAPVALRVTMGEIYFEQQDFDNAESYFKKALAGNPNELGAIAGLSRLYFAVGKTAAAEELLKKGLSLSANYVPLMELKSLRNGK